MIYLKSGPTMLVDQHSDGDAAHVEAIQKVLDVLVGDHILGKDLLVFQDPLRHSGHHVIMSVSDGDQGINKPGDNGYAFSCKHLPEPKKK